MTHCISRSEFSQYQKGLQLYQRKRI